MARLPMVTRTITTTKVNVLCLDIEHAEPCNKVVTIPRTYKDEETILKKVKFPSPTGDLYFSIPSPQFLVNTDCITQFAWEMIFQKYKFIFHYKKLSKCLFYAVRGKTNIF